MSGQGSQTRRQMRRAHKKKQRQQQARSPRPWEANSAEPPRPYTPLRAAVVPPTVQAVTLTDFARARRMEENAHGVEVLRLWYKSRPAWA